MDKLKLSKLEEMEKLIKEIKDSERTILSVILRARAAVEFLMEYHKDADLYAKTFTGNYVHRSIFSNLNPLAEFDRVWEPSSDSVNMLFEFLITSLLVVPKIYLIDPRENREDMIESFIVVVGNLGGDLEDYRDDIRNFIFIEDLSWERWKICEDSDVRKQFFNFIVHQIVGSPESIATAKKRYEHSRSLLKTSGN